MTQIGHPLRENFQTRFEMSHVNVWCRTFAPAFVCDRAGSAELGGARKRWRRV